MTDNQPREVPMVRYAIPCALLLLCACSPKPPQAPATTTATPPATAAAPSSSPPPAGEAPRPPLKGVDGFITGGSGRFEITFAADGVPGNGGFCCAASVAEARKAYANKNLIALPTTAKPTSGVVPPLTGIGGYIVATGDGRYRVDFAVDGVRGAGGFCCAATVEAAHAAYPDKSFAYLP